MHPEGEIFVVDTRINLRFQMSAKRRVPEKPGSLEYHWNDRDDQDLSLGLNMVFYLSFYNELSTVL